MKATFPASELAGMPGMPKHKRNVLIMARQEGWAFDLIPGQSGRRRGFLFTSLPEITRAALLLRYASTSSAGTLLPASCQAPPPPFWRLDSSLPGVSQPGAEASYASTGGTAVMMPRPARNSAPVIPADTTYIEYDHVALQRDFALRTDKQKAVAVKMASAIDQALGLIAAGGARTRAWATAANWYGCRRETLQYRWYPKVKGCHRQDWPAVLCPGYNGCTARAEFSPDALEFYKADYLRQEKPNYKACYRRLKRAAMANNWVIPSPGTARRRILKEVSYETRVFQREGNEGLMKIYPAQERTVSASHALEWINGDGYQHNVFVKWPDGTIGRPKTWFIQDAYSRKILAWRTDKTEHADLIRLATGDLIEKYGIPEHCVIDNTRAAANKWMTGGVKNRYRFKIKDDDPLGMFPMLGIKTHWTSVNFGHGHGQAKPVERAFGIGGIGEVVDKHPAFAGAWTGNNPLAKPENYGSLAITIADFIRIRNEEVAAHNAQPNRRTEMGAGRLSFDEVFDESYQKSVISKATAEQRALWLLAAEAVLIGREGTFTLNAGGAPGVGRNRYYSNALYDYVGKKCVVRFDPDDLHADTHIYSLDGKYITAAACADPVGFGDTGAARDHSRSRNQFVRARKEKANAEVRMTAIEAAKLIPPMPNAEPAEATVIQMVRPSRTLLEHRVPKQPEMSDEERASRDAEIEDEMAAERERQRWPDTCTLNDSGKYRYWHELERRMAAGDEFPEQARLFYEGFQKTHTFQSYKATDRDLAFG